MEKEEEITNVENERQKSVERFDFLTMQNKGKSKGKEWSGYFFFSLSFIVIFFFITSSIISLKARMYSSIEWL